jgi:hypothetical protein
VAAESRFALAALATWRITHLLAEEDGPADVVARARANVPPGVGRLMDCFACLSVWVAALFAPAAAQQRRNLPLTWLALSGAACLLERATAEAAAPIDVAPDDEALEPAAVR